MGVRSAHPPKGISLFIALPFHRGNAFRSVNMTQRHIVKIGKNRGIYIVRAADGNLFGFAGSCTGDELVGQQYVSGSFGDIHFLHCHPDRIGVAINPFVRVIAPDMGGFDKGENPEKDFAMTVRKGNGRNLAIVYR